MITRFKTNLRKSFFGALILTFSGIFQIQPASAALTNITVTADSFTYVAGSGFEPTYTATVSAAMASNPLNITCRVYTNSDSSYTTPIDVSTLASNTSGTYKIHCTAPDSDRKSTRLNSSH